MTDPKNFFSEVMDLFMARYAPCETMDQATHFFSTDEIHRALHDLHPGCGIRKEDVYIHLREYGYRFMIEDQKFSFSLKWMLTEQ